MFKIYEENDYYSEDKSYITTPEIDTLSELMLAFNLVMGFLTLMMIGVSCGL